MTWVQLNIALSRERGPVLDQARRVFDAVVPQIDAARVEGDLRRFHFMRKPPDIRLRLQGPAPGDNLLPGVEATLHRLWVDGVVTAFSAGGYEPETRLFGGARAMDLVHDHFDVDSRAWVDHDRLRRAGSAALSAERLTTGVVNDLFALTLDDRGEVWDTWCNVLHVVGEPDCGEQVDATPVRGVEELAEGASAAEREVLSRYREANTHLATGLRGLAHHGQLDCGLRVLLPFVAVFHLHRYGLDRHRQAAQAHAMVHAWDPRRGMRGWP